MGTVAGRTLLEWCRKGDEVAIGFKTPVNGWRPPIVERIRKLGRGEVSGVKLKFALEIDGREKKEYDYFSNQVKPCPAAKTGGSLMVLEFAPNGLMPSEAMRPVYDFCDLLPEQPHGIWYHREGEVPKWEYGISEARVAINAAAARTGLGRPDLAGTYHIDRMKIFRAVEMETMKKLDGDTRIRKMVEEDAYYIGTWGRGSDNSENWSVAKSRMATRLMRHMDRDRTLLAISGELTTDDSMVGELNEPDKKEAYTRIFDLLNRSGIITTCRGIRVRFTELDADSIHLAPAGLPFGIYINNYLMSGSSHMPGDD